VDSRQFEVPPVGLAMREPRNVELNGVTVCQIFELVMVAELGLRGACNATGGASLSLYSDFRSSDALFRLTVALIENSGGVVTVERGTVLVSGEAGEDQAAFSAPPPGGPSVSQPQSASAPPAGFTVPVGPLEANSARRALQMVDGVGSLYVVGDAEEVQAAISSLSLDVTAAQVGQRVLLVGNVEALQTVRAMLGASDVDVHSFPSDMSQEMAAGLAAEFGVRLVPGREGYVTVAGVGPQVADFLQASHALGLRSSQRAVSAAFVFGNERQLRNLSLSLTGGVEVGSTVVNIGNGQALSALVSGLSQASGITIREEPSVSAVDGTPAVFLSGREVPVQTEVDQDGRGSVEYRDVGTRLRVLTSSRPGGLVRVDLRLEVSSVDGAGVQANPTFSTRSVETGIVARPGDVLVISGFTGDRNETQDRLTVFGLGGLRDRETTRLAVLLQVR
jgi:hypothetical protein